jgi:hypothetical protein
MTGWLRVDAIVSSEWVHPGRRRVGVEGTWGAGCSDCEAWAESFPGVGSKRTTACRFGGDSERTGALGRKTARLLDSCRGGGPCRFAAGNRRGGEEQARKFVPTGSQGACAAGVLRGATKKGRLRALRSPARTAGSSFAVSGQTLLLRRSAGPPADCIGRLYPNPCPDRQPRFF